MQKNGAMLHNFENVKWASDSFKKMLILAISRSFQYFLKICWLDNEDLYDVLSVELQRGEGINNYVNISLLFYWQHSGWIKKYYLNLRECKEWGTWLHQAINN